MIDPQDMHQWTCDLWEDENGPQSSSDYCSLCFINWEMELINDPCPASAYYRCRKLCDGEHVHNPSPMTSIAQHRWCLQGSGPGRPKGTRRCASRRRWEAAEGFGIWDAYGGTCTFHSQWIETADP